MARCFAGLGLLWLAVVAAPARAEPSRALQTEVEAVLAAGIEQTVPPETFLAFGVDAVPTLIAVLEREDAEVYVRLRAASTLARLSDARATRRTVELLRAAHLVPKNGRPDDFMRSPLVLRRVLDGLAARSDLKLSVESVAPLLDHDDLHVRRACAALLARLLGAEVERALARRLAVERSRLVRAALHKALTSRSARPPAPPPARPESGSPPR